MVNFVKKLSKDSRRFLGSLIIFLFAAAAMTYLFFIGIVTYRNSIVPRGIVIHHSALPFKIEDPENVEIISDLHRRRGYRADYLGKTYFIGYHYIILPDGSIVKGRPDNCQGAHAAGYNSYLGVCLIGDFSGKDNPDGLKGPKIPTPEQMQSLLDLTKNLSQRYQIPTENIIPHKNINTDTECPGMNFPFEDFLGTMTN
jgi:N-acetylmuramoyl-L-alanine amidase